MHVSIFIYIYNVVSQGSGPLRRARREVNGSGRLTG